LRAFALFMLEFRKFIGRFHGKFIQNAARIPCIGFSDPITLAPVCTV
jgi:hypothetical protein